jgi:CheY-like chemotaxis protein
VSADEAVRAAQREHPDVALVDVRLVGVRDGIDAAEEMFNRFGVPTIFVTANTDAQTRGRAQAVRPLGISAKATNRTALKKRAQSRADILAALTRESIEASDIARRLRFFCGRRPDALGQ